MQKLKKKNLPLFNSLPAAFLPRLNAKRNAGIFMLTSSYKLTTDGSSVMGVCQEHFWEFKPFLAKCRLVYWDSTWAATDDVSQEHNTSTEKNAD